MDSRTGFQRNFFIFANEDTGFETGRKPSGYVRMEVREGKGKLHTVLQNLRPGNGKFEYVMYLLRASREPVEYIRVGNLEVRLGKAELEWTFDPRNAGMSGYAINEFDVMAVVVEHTNRQIDTISCPLAAYRSKHVDWRIALRTALQRKKAEAAYKPEKDSPVFQKTAKTITTPVIKAPAVTAPTVAAPVVTTPVVTTPAITESNLPENMQEMKQFENIMDENPKEAIYENAGIITSDEAGAHPPVNNINTTWIQPCCIQPLEAYQPQPEMQYFPQQHEYHQLQEPIQQPPYQPEQQFMYQPEQQSRNQPEQQFMYQPEQQPIYQPEQHPENQLENQPEQQPEPIPENQPEQQPGMVEESCQNSLNQVNTGCVYLNGNLCGALIQNAVGTENPCNTCRINRVEEPDQMHLPGDLTPLKEELDRYFEQSDPFHSKRSDYSWWKVSNPVNLNNILYKNNVRSPLMFNPSVMMAHYKYRHLIIGIFSRKDGKKFVVCGVPGMHMVDRKPFGEMSTWVQTEGNRIRYGEFGYWLVYVNPEDGKILNLNKD